MLFNEHQKKAISYISGPCLILAGAGSGKTRVIINKIVHLIKICHFDPKCITAITFTNKAACEMKSRILNVLSVNVSNLVKISTFHALGLEIIKSEIELLNIKSNFTIFDEQDQISILQEIVSKEDRSFVRQIRQSISNWKNKLLCPNQVNKISNSSIEFKFFRYYELYNAYLKSSNILDFDDLIFLPTILLRDNKLSRERWNDKIKYLLVDEYQDTNFIQYKLIKLLSSKRSNFTLVGDDDQSIYSWRGANIHNFESLKHDYPNLRTIIMQHNYRSSGRILKVANALISNNLHFFNKKLFSNLDYGSIVEIISAKNEEDEARVILQTLMLHKSNYNAQYKDYAILYRSNYQVKIFEKFLIKFKIPYKILANISFFSRPEIKDLIAYLRLIINPDDNAAFLRVVNRPLRGIGAVTLQKLKEWSKKRNQSFFMASLDIGLESILPVHNLKSLQEFVYLIQTISYQIQLNPIEVLEKLVATIKYEKWLMRSLKFSKLYVASIKNISIVLNWIINELKYKIMNSKKFVMKYLIDIISEFILQNSLNEDIVINNDYVQLMTLHASKGLEFLYVFIVGVEEGVLPYYRNTTMENNIDEERRLAYVGITRAQKKLFLSYAIQRCQYGVVINTKPSRFLRELPQSDILWQKSKILNLNEKNNFLFKAYKKSLKKKLLR
ncbi:ATP-dependent DNA helicase Rep [Buchnera aphidicola str. Bp (Baizongia pistaciae)]|uniref:ATP-dependent DNA helicase Rep n=1 Tax=Buchnera aphidicola subsp. Baizongia pistaciae (strain Bp) TaxID=224915 RepID=REP_BUCBP|nr:UvrD-helicase domain-containing protein [Buchnera aphidicola]Q89A21.1 RecName: Full=ATP-dependent DNA helicase Rep; AltName: Full=DNA 3'-5' helicase Rep [Buchnera aphidicola str. Bp (Baizongia pistaciae)]AAO27239.1 ATP-dependent DNA helicase Rep [Buchnera aphidicola str. Bp (Baizongia pistaciae)]